MMNGVGAIQCNSCRFRQNITSHLHRFGENNWFKNGYQCQKCGKFHAIEGYDNVEMNKCECGELLEREKAIFCPRCKTKDVTYTMLLMT